MKLLCKIITKSFFNPSISSCIKLLWCKGLSLEVPVDWIHWQVRLLFVWGEKEKKK